MKKSMVAIVVLAIFVVLSIAIVLFAPQTDKVRKQTTAFDITDLNFDIYETMIYELLSENHTFSAIPFITYEVLGRDDDTFYQRTYLYAMIDDIDATMYVHNTYVYPFAFVFDRDNGQLLRSFFPDDDSDRTAFDQNFPSEIVSQINIDYLQHIERIEKLHATNIWDAETFFGIENEE